MKNIIFKLFYKAFKMKALIQVCKDYERDELSFFKYRFDLIDQERKSKKKDELEKL